MNLRPRRIRIKIYEEWWTKHLRTSASRRLLLTTLRLHLKALLNSTIVLIHLNQRMRSISLWRILRKHWYILPLPHLATTLRRQATSSGITVGKTSSLQVKSIGNNGRYPRNSIVQQWFKGPPLFYYRRRWLRRKQNSQPGKSLGCVFFRTPLSLPDWTDEPSCIYSIFRWKPVVMILLVVNNTNTIVNYK